jgi:hypothetical protein
MHDPQLAPYWMLAHNSARASASCTAHINEKGRCHDREIHV